MMTLVLLSNLKNNKPRTKKNDFLYTTQGAAELGFVFGLSS
jgi:hypothetical protein